MAILAERFYVIGRTFPMTQKQAGLYASPAML